LIVGIRLRSPGSVNFCDGKFSSTRFFSVK
jgi:hypothetical protein